MLQQQRQRDEPDGTKDINAAMPDVAARLFGGYGDDGHGITAVRAAGVRDASSAA
jgi:hypothetical protein